MFSQYIPQNIFCNCRTHLEQLGLWDENRKLQAIGDQVAIPIIQDASTLLGDITLEVDCCSVENTERKEKTTILEGIKMQLTSVALPQSKKVSL